MFVARLRLLLAAALASGAASDMCDWSPDPSATPNAFAIGAPPAGPPARTAAHGAAWRAGVPGAEFWISHLYGSDYEMGFAHGALFRAETAAFYDAMWAWLEAQVAASLPGTWPPWFATALAEAGLDVALDLLAAADAPFVGANIVEEMRGLADGSGVDLARIRRLHLIAELTQGQCSLVGAWGAATRGGVPLFGRGFDWQSGCPCRSFPALHVYHGGSGLPFLSAGWTGWIGAFTAVSSARTAAAMIGVEYPDASFGNESFVGVPFVFLLRDLVQFESNGAAMLAHIAAANRTCNLVVGVADGRPGAAAAFRGVEYSASVAAVYDDQTLLPVNDTWHPRIDGVVYNMMDYLCPTFDAVGAGLLQKMHGRLTAEGLVRDFFPIVQSGNIHAAVLDWAADALFVSFMAPANASHALPTFAFDRPYVRFDLAALFAQQMPRSG